MKHELQGNLTIKPCVCKGDGHFTINTKADASLVGPEAVCWGYGQIHHTRHAQGELISQPCELQATGEFMTSPACSGDVMLGELVLDGHGVYVLPAGKSRPNRII